MVNSELNFDSRTESDCNLVGYKTIQRNEYLLSASLVKKDSRDSLSYFKLFKYSTTWEKILILFSILCSIISGFGLPLTMLKLGDMLNIMLKYQATNVSVYNNSINLNISSKQMSDGEFYDEIKFQALEMAVIGGILFVVVFIMVTLMNYTAEKQVFRIRSLYLKAIMKQEIGWFDINNTGDFSSKVGENLEKLLLGIGEKIALTMYFVGTFIVSNVIGIVIGWKLSLVILSVMPFLIITLGGLSSIQARLAETELKYYGKAGAIAEECFGAIKTVSAFGGEDKEISRFKESIKESTKAGYKKSIATSITMSGMQFFIYIAYAIGFWYGTKLILDTRIHHTEDYDPGKMLKIFTNITLGAMFLGSAAPFFQVFSVAKAAAIDIFRVIELVPNIDGSSKLGLILDEMEGEIKFEHVGFSYPSRKNVRIYNDLSFTIKKGETVAIVGPSGGGKSTITQLIQRFYDVDFGKVLIDGVDITTLNVGYLRDNIGVVGQEPSLFGVSIRDNILLGREVPENEMIEAAKASNAHNFIQDLPDMYDTIIDSKGSHISGGQKQRIAIARALVRNPKILLLDEATSALDLESESRVQEALDKASQGRTTIIIAHRLSTVRKADRILVLDDGKIIEEGTHDELLKQKGQYFNLVNFQMTNEELVESDEKAVEQSKLLRAVSQTGSVSGSLKSEEEDTGFKNNDDYEVKNVVRKVMKLNKPELIYLILGCIFAVIVGCSYSLYAYIYGEVLAVFNKNDYDEMRTASFNNAMIFVGIAFGTLVMSFFQTLFFELSGLKLTERVRLITFSAMIKQSIEWHDDKKNSVGSLCTMLSNDCSQIQGATGALFSTVIQGFVTIISVYVMSFILDWQLTLITLAPFPILLLCSYYDVKLTTDSALFNKKALVNANQVAVEALNNIRTVASLHQEKHFINKYISYLSKSKIKIVINSAVRAFVISLSQGIIPFMYAGTFVYSAYIMINYGAKYYDLFRILEGVLVGSYVTSQALAFSKDYQNAKVSASRILKLLEQKPSIDITNNSGTKLHNFEGNVTFQDVRFKYASRPDVRVLRSLNFTVKQGNTVALVGTSGCGKSTCIQLIQRFYDCDFGDVLMDSVENTTLNLKWLRSQIGLVQQEPILFDYSIADNIAYGKVDELLPMQNIIEAAKDANIHDFIMSLPNGYDTQVGSKGTQLSGGQKQRVAIARALIRKPKLLLLDEATSALDSESEKIVEEALQRARKGRSCIVIAHRLSTIQNADCILVLKHGKVIESGTHQELLKLKCHYYSLYQKQASSVLS